MARRTLYHDPSGNRPSKSDIAAEEHAPDPRTGMVPCPHGCKIRFWYRGSIAWNQHMAADHAGKGVVS